MIRKLMQWLLHRGLSQEHQSFQPPDGVQFGDGCRVLGVPRVKVVPGAQIICGPQVVLNSDPYGYHAGMSIPVTLLADRPDALIHIGEGSRLHGCCVHAWSHIEIGRLCLFAAGSQVLDAHGHVTSLELARLRSRVQDRPEPIQIGDYNWIGLGALILKGARLGEGCIVAAYSVVTSGDYPPFSLLAGAPARVVRTIEPQFVLPADYPVEQLEMDGESIYTY
ncbi:MAG: acyltransferase [Anaerolineales bacterium]|nr:acyltransferase [Anaerolineales bacterium]